MKPRIVVSGVNLVEGGPLSILSDVLDELSEHWSGRYEIVALVHRKALFRATKVTYLEFSRIKGSWLRRVYFEYWRCMPLSKRLRPDLWLAIHDMTPRVEASIRAVYCHNPAPFYRPSIGEAWMHWRFTLFTLVYGFLYRFNLQRNHFVIVQQQWLRREFQQRYGHPSIVVAHPSMASARIPSRSPVVGNAYRFFYPALPRSFKNIETILAAARILETRGVEGFQIILTTDGTESRYAARLRESARDLRTVQWLGLISRDRVLQLYAETDCLLFPSKLETWGMPISEFRQTGKPMLLADLPYAHETVGTYSPVHFCGADDAEAWAQAMAQCLGGTLHPGRVPAPTIAAPFAADWHQLFELLLKNSACP